MGYIGRPIGTPGHTTQKLDDPTSIANDGFVMKVATVPISPDAASLALYVDGVRQEAGEAYTVSGSTVTFTGDFTSSNDFHGYVMGDAMYIQTNSVDSDHYVNGSIDVEHLADNSIDEASLYADNSPTNDYALTAKSSATGGLTWAAVTDTNDDVNIANLTARLPQITESVTIGDATDVTVTIAGGLVVNGTTTTVNSTTLTVDDKNIELGSVSSPSDSTADGGGITLKGASDKTILWTNSDDKWHFNQGIVATTLGTGDLTLKNDKGHYTIWEEEEYLAIKNENTGKKYKFVLEAIDE